MIINQEYDLTGAIQSAIKAKAPYVGVPMPGHAPLIFKRSLLAGALGKQTRTGKLDSRQFYTAMDTLPGIGKVTRYSELDTRQKESIKRDIRETFGRNGFLDYANPKMLWRFMPSQKTWCGGKPYSLRPLAEDDEDTPRWGAKRYEPVLEWQRERKEILSAIASIREMQVEVIPIAPTFEEFIRQIAA